jgi:hypothetical protein
MVGSRPSPPRFSMSTCPSPMPRNLAKSVAVNNWNDARGYVAALLEPRALPWSSLSRCLAMCRATTRACGQKMS